MVELAAVMFVCIVLAIAIGAFFDDIKGFAYEFAGIAMVGLMLLAGWYILKPFGH